MTGPPVAERIPAVVLAGGSTSPAFAEEAGLGPGTGGRALADINGLPMVRYVLRALKEAETVRTVILVAPGGFPPQPEADVQLTGDGGIVDNIETGLAACEGAEHAILITADIPFIKGSSVDDYVRDCLALRTESCYCAVPESACQAQFPGMKRTYLPTPNGRYTGGNVVVQNVAAFVKVAAMLREAYPRRKNPAFLTRLIGVGNVLKLLTRRIQLSDVEQGVSRATGARCRLVVTEHADLGSDVDRPEDLRLARKLLFPG
jgi:molybdopterin-guanine dinucleotide biosynthesis protein A